MKWHEWKCYIDCHWESFNDAASTKQDRSHGALRVTIRSPALMHSRTQTHTDTHVKSEHSIHLCPVQLYVMPPPPHPPSPPPASRPPPHGEGDSRGVGHGAAVAAADDEVTLPEAAKGAAERGGGAMWRGGGSGVTRRAGGCNHVLTLPELLPTPPHPPTHRSSVLSLSLRSSPPSPSPTLPITKPSSPALSASMSMSSAVLMTQTLSWQMRLCTTASIRDRVMVCRSVAMDRARGPRDEARAWRWVGLEKRER